MGLSLQVGILADLKAHDEEGYLHVKDEFERVSALLAAHDLPPHEENEGVEEGDSWSCDLGPYSGLHTLRRVAAHLWFAGKLPPPAKEGHAAEDPVAEKYYRARMDKNPGLFARFFGRKPGRGPTFDHLMLHSDAEGYYVPLDFENVLFSEKKTAVTGDLLGSSIRLKAECEILANRLGLPLDLDPESDRVLEAVDSPGSGSEPWEAYGVEAYTCLQLLGACAASIRLGCAVAFC